MDNMCKFKILSINHKTIILRKPKYLNKLIYEKLIRNTHLQYSNLCFKFVILYIRTPYMDPYRSSGTWGSWVS